MKRVISISLVFIMVFALLPMNIVYAAKVKPMVCAGDAIFQHYMVLDEFGDVWGWGDNHYGKIGDGTNTDRYSPVKINISNIKSILDI